MKKVFTLCVAIMASVATFAQTTLWDGEDTVLFSKKKVLIKNNKFYF